jgi:hypothetical protein
MFVSAFLLDSIWETAVFLVVSLALAFFIAALHPFPPPILQVKDLFPGQLPWSFEEHLPYSNCL